MKTPFAVLCALAFAVSSAACGGNSGPVDSGLTVSQAVGASGATVTTGDGTGITIPSGALGSSTTVSVTVSSTAATPPDMTLVGSPAVISVGAALSASATIVLSFDASSLPSGSSASDITIEQQPNGLNAFFALTTTVVDASHVSAQVQDVNGTFAAAVASTNCPLTSGYPGNSCSWGVSVGSTFPDITLAGGASLNFATKATVDSTTSLASSFAFSQLQALAAQGFRYAFLDISAVWCPHCNEEAQTLPSQYVPTWLAQGGIVFSILVQSGSPNSQGIYPPATQTDLTDWITKYNVNYPMSLDTEENMVTATGLNAWPANLIIRLSDMTVIDSVFGATDAFYQEFGDTLLSCQTTADCWSGATCNSSGQCQN